jgi:hypothetical protein
MPAATIASVISVYVILTISIVGNITYFVYSTQTDLADNWTKYGFVPALCFGFFALGAIWAFMLQKRESHREEIRYHTSNQLWIVFILMIGGILSAVQTSAQWLLENDLLGGVVNVLLILIVIYVVGCLVVGLVRSRMLWTAVRTTQP